jgi:energy-coupling factor transporter ATP-binding protein EcfA2
MIKQQKSWWKDNEIPNLIGRKKVDFSIFHDGSHIPTDFHEDFMEANQGHLPGPGQSQKLKLIYDDHTFEALLIRIRQSTGREVLHIRYTGRQEIKELLTKKFTHSYSYIMNERANQQTDEQKKTQVNVPDDQAEYISFYETGTPYEYRMEFLIYTAMPNIWWVNQGETIQAAKKEGILWAPLLNKKNRKEQHWERMLEVKQGDIILHYSNKAIRYVSQVTDIAIEALIPASLENKSNNWSKKGRLIRTSYNEIIPAIAIEDINQQIMQLNITQGPLHSGGGVNQGYLYRFSRQGLKMLQAYKPEVNWPGFAILDSGELETSLIPSEVIPILPPNDDKISILLNKIKSYIQQKGFFFPNHLIENFYLSLKTKPFVILAGISGTGKTRLVKLFAEAVGATKENKQYTLIPVRPDWSDPSDLVGYKDLAGKFRPGPLTDVLVEARIPENLNKPYFICLDEMNLARVEHYFSDLLSVLETQEWVEKKIKTQDIISSSSLDTTEDQIKYSNLSIPENVFLIGTVNMDETTYPFSKKVLDRANTIEFNNIDLNQFPDLAEHELTGDSDEINGAVSEHQNNHFLLRSDYLQLIDAYEMHKDLVVRTTERLVEINALLEDAHANVGFRVRDAICFYMIYNERFKLMSEEEAFDHQLMQKILPRIQGSNSSVRRVLLELMKVTLGNNSGVTLNMKELMDNVASELYSKWERGKTPPNSKYPKSARKLAFMLRRLDEDGFTSYWLS